MSEFSRVSAAVADEICRIAGVKPETRPQRLAGAQVELLFQAIPKVRILAPPTACLSPIGEQLLVQGLEARIRPEFATAVTRPPAVYRGNPFQVEVGIALPDESVSCVMTSVPCGMKHDSADNPPRYFPAPPESVISLR